VNLKTGVERERVDTYGISPDGRFEIIEHGSKFAVRDRSVAEIGFSFEREKDDRVHLSPCSTLLLVKNGARVSIYNLKSRKLVYKGNAAASLIEFSMARKSVFFAQSSEGETRFQEVTSEGVVSARPHFKHQSAVTAFCIDEAGRRLCTASRDSVIRVFSFDSSAQGTNRMVAKVSNIGTVNAIRFSPDGKWLLTGSDDGTARIWDVETGYPLSEPFEHVRRVDRVEFSPDQKRILVAGDGQIRVWQMPPAGVAPEWLPLAAEVVSGFRIGEDGSLIDVPFDDAQKLKAAIAQETQSKDVAEWVKAFLPD
jgi:WD40 repeat protein